MDKLTTTSTKKTILVIEDEKLLMNAIVKKLEISGFETVALSRGGDVIKFIENPSVIPDLIWMDYYLPDTNGIELIKAFNFSDIFKNTPVFVVSNSASSEKVEAMSKLGAKCYLLKTQNSLEDVITLVRKEIASQ